MIFARFRCFYIMMLLSILRGEASGKIDDSIFFQKQLEQASSGDGVVRLEPRIYHLGDVTIPRTLLVDFGQKGGLSVSPGCSIRWDGGIRAGRRQIFFGGGKVTGAPEVERVYPQWFGARGDDRHDDGPALTQAAAFAAAATGRLLFIPKGRYRFENPVRIASDVECHGVLVSLSDIDYEKKDTSYFLDWYHMKNYPWVRIIPDEEPIELDPEYFYGVREDAFLLPAWKDIPTVKNPDRKITLVPGGTLTFHSTDFFTSRNVLNQDRVYEKLDICKVVSTRGDVFPEFVFSYEKHDQAEEWQSGKLYKRGDYVRRRGILYKASFPSGPGVVHSNRYHGKVTLGSIDPATHADWPFVYPNGRKEVMHVWRPVKMVVRYTPPQAPLTISGLTVELRSKVPMKRYEQVYGRGFSVSRSNVTFNRLSVVATEPFLRFYMIANVVNCTDVIFNDCLFSGATNQRGGYNISNSNVACVTYNNCTSLNARDGMGGRHGKNITIRGGHYNVIDDHYGLNYMISGVTFHCRQPWIDGFYTPKNKPQDWYFRNGWAAVAFGGRNITIENCRIFGGRHLLYARNDTGDFGGRVDIRNVDIHSSIPFCIVNAHEQKNFDYAHRVRTPVEMSINHVLSMMGQPLTIELPHWRNAWPLTVRHCRNLSGVTLSRVMAHFHDCAFREAEFKLTDQAMAAFRHCFFSGKVTGLSGENIGYASEVLMDRKNAFPVKLPFVNQKQFFLPE